MSAQPRGRRPRVRAFGGGPAAARALADVGVLLSEIGCPAPGAPDPRGAMRIGTQTVARQGFTEADMPAVAAPIAGGLRATRPAKDLRAEVAAIRRRHRGIRVGASGEWLTSAADPLSTLSA